MRATGPLLPSRRLWTRREGQFRDIVWLALQQLHKTRPHPNNECDLNRKFHFALLEACRVLDPKGKLPPPVQEACNQPDPDDPSRAKRESKRPDFQWVYLDPHEPDAKRASRQFIIECKRLGDSGDANWVLNENYVAHGVVRFVHPDWSYAKGFPSALMVGYWQSMPMSKVLGEVNQTLAFSKAPLPKLANAGACTSMSGLVEFSHFLSRPFPINPLELVHFWVDVG